MFENYKKDIEYCTFCPNMCRFVCPVTIGTGKETYVPTKKMQFLYLIMKGTYDLSDPEYNEAFNYCTACMACTEYCDHNIDIAKILLDGRNKVVSHGVIPESSVKIRENCLKYSNPYGKKLNFNKKIEKYLSDDAQVLLFPGYTAFFEAPNLIDNFFTLSEKIAIDYVAVDNRIISSGYPLYILGFKEEFISFAKKTAMQLSQYKLIITLDPVDAYMFKIVYEEFGIEINSNIKTLDEFLKDNLALLKEKFSEPVMKSFSYHDSCYLGRYAGIYEQPREISSLFFKNNRENPWHHKDSFCCGRGDMLFLTHEKESDEIAKKRLTHFDNLNIDAIVTSCPGGVVQLNKNNTGNKKILHILELFLLEGKK